MQAGQGSQDSLRRKVFEALMHPRPLEGCPALKRVSRTKCEPERTTVSRPIGSTCRESLGRLCSGNQQLGIVRKGTRDDSYLAETETSACRRDWQ